MGGMLRKYLKIVLGRLIICVIILGLAGLVAVGLSSLKKPPAEAVVAERAISVEVKRVAAEDVPVLITGFGEARPLVVVQLAAEVAGRVTAVHPRLKLGEIIPEGELLFRIDPVDYAAAKHQAEAMVAQQEAAITRLKQQQTTDTERLRTLARTRELARKDFDRARELFEVDEVGTQSGVDAVEMQFNQANDAHDQLAQVVALYPARLRETESALAAARAQLDMANTALARTEVHAPFTARLSQVMLEAGQYVRPGEPVLVLADDSLLEISVSVDSRDARRWLQFQSQQDGDAWFGELTPVSCRIRWTEDLEANSWAGTLHRVEEFNEQTRTVTVAVRVPREAGTADSGGLPLVAGMFCEVEIPGKTMQGVYRLPRWAVSFEGQTYVAEEGRLKVRDVEVLRTQGEETFVREGLAPGDQVVVTRLVNPLPNTLLNTTAGDGMAATDQAENAL